MSSKVKTITVFCDPGHSWAKVKLSELLVLDICHKISMSSYLMTTGTRSKVEVWAYLETHKDLTIYIEALKAKKNIEVIMYKEHQSNKTSKIRNHTRIIGQAIKDEYDKGSETTDWVRVLMAVKTAYAKARG